MNAIINDRERKQYQQLKSLEDKVEFFKRFWLVRDLTPATEVNERLVEHYQRLNYARKYYSSIDWRGYDDRGRIYIKYGEPDEIVSDPVPSFSYPLETWAYYRFGSAITFDFVYDGYAYRQARRFDEGIKNRSMPLVYMSMLYRFLLKRAFLSPAYTNAFIQIDKLVNDIPLEKKLKAEFQFRLQYQLERIMNEYEIKTYNNQKKLPLVVTDIFHNIIELPFIVQISHF